jgi:uncharacterized protein (DUF433 family)
MVIQYKNQLGYGIYTIPDISMLLGYPQYKVRRYLKNYLDDKLWKSKYADKYSWSMDGKRKAVNFLVLIELFTFFTLRDRGLSTFKIAKARDEISNYIKSPYPFANAEVLYDKKTIWFRFNSELMQVGTRQLPLEKVIESFAKKIDFSGDNLAERYWPNGKTSSIVVDPKHQFGQPVIKGTNINIEVIKSMHESGEPESAICSLYDLTNKEFKDAIQFFNKAA